MPASFQERCAGIEMLILDVDGVLTDGRIIYTERGDEIKAFHVRDGSGLKLWGQAGKRLGIITGRRSALVERRARELGIHAVLQGVDDKRQALLQMLRAHQLAPAQSAYMGDDLPDVPALRQAGLALVAPDACAEARALAHYITKAPGGQGAVREAIEVILQAQGLWQNILARYCEGHADDFQARDVISEPRP